MRGRGTSEPFIVNHSAINVDSCDVGQATPIDVLPDDVLLAIFDFCVAGVRDQETKRAVESWQSLVHVCRRWRRLVFESPRRLNLRLVCTPRTPAKGTLDVWPALPLITRGAFEFSSGVDNIIIALGHHNRVRRTELWITLGSHLDKVFAAMHVPFPALDHLWLHCEDETAPVLPNSFLGGSAPQLRYLQLERVPFPGLPKLLLSATHLVYLYLHGIPHSGYFSPEAIVNSLSVLTSLGTLSLEFPSPQSRPDRESQHPPPISRSVLPALTGFWFKGVSEYLEDLVVWIDAPQLDVLYITFLHQIRFNTPRLVQFVSRTPRFKEPQEVDVNFCFDAAEVRLMSCTSSDYGELAVEIPCEEWDQQLEFMAQVCTMCLPPLPTVETLGVYVKDTYSQQDWDDDVENNQWLELLRPFTAVKDLYLSKDFQQGIASALQELVGGRTTEVLPSLQKISLLDFEPSELLQEAIGRFVDARQLSGHPITVLPLWSG